MGVEASKMDEGLKEFMRADDFRDARDLSSQFLQSFNLDPNNQMQAVKKIKQTLLGKKKTPWAYLEKKASHPVYQRSEVCKDLKVLVIGCGPCGLRMAIEAALLGAKVRMVEAKDTFDRHNVINLWPFVIQDLKKLGARAIYPEFCTNGKDHISIRRLQLILLKVALLLGVEIAAPVTFDKLVLPGDEKRWRAKLSPRDHDWNDWEFDVIVGAAGKGNVLTDFKSKCKMRKKQTILITANFKNYRSEEEAKLEDTGARFKVLQQEFFDNLKKKTGLELESFVYYKDETHSFVMTVKRDNLIRNKILKEKTAPKEILNPSNVNRQNLLACVKKVVKTATNNGIPFLDVNKTKSGEEDVNLFDCTAAFHTDNACMVKERLGCSLLQMVVGDRLMEPFWPTGAGCARGFLSVLDGAWLLIRWVQRNASPLELIAERESIYQLLPQTTPESLKKDISHYTVDPATRYGGWAMTLTVQPRDVCHLYDTDHPVASDEMAKLSAGTKDTPRTLTLRQSKDAGSDAKDLLSWYQKQLKLYKKVKVTNLTTSWSNGIALCAALHSVDQDMVDMEKVFPGAAEENVGKAFTIIEAEFNFRPFMTPEEVASGDNIDKVEMFAFLGRLRQALINYNQSAEQRDPCIYGNRGHHLYDSLATMLYSIGFIPPKKSLTPKGSAQPSLELAHVDTADTTASEDNFAAKSPPGERPLPAPPKPPRVHFDSETTRGILTETSSKSKPEIKPKPRHKSAPAFHQEEEDEEEMYIGSPDRAETGAADPHPSLAALSSGGVVKKRLKELRFEDDGMTASERRPKLQEKSKSADDAAFESVFDMKLLSDRVSRDAENCCLCGKKMLIEDRRRFLEDSVSGRAFSFHRECFRCKKCNCTLRYGNVLPHRDQSGKISFYCFMHAPQKSQLRRYKSATQQGEVQQASSTSSQDVGFGPKSLAKYLGENLLPAANADEASGEDLVIGSDGAGVPDDGKDREEEYGDLNVSVMENQSYASLKSTHLLVAHELQLELDQLEEMEEDGVTDQSFAEESMFFSFPNKDNLTEDQTEAKVALSKKLDDLQERIVNLHQKLESTDPKELPDILEDLEHRTKMYEDSMGISS